MFESSHRRTLQEPDNGKAKRGGARQNKRNQPETHTPKLTRVDARSKHRSKQRPIKWRPGEGVARGHSMTAQERQCWTLHNMVSVPC